MWGKKGTRVKWPQMANPDKVGVELSMSERKPLGIQLLQNCTYRSQDIVQYFDELNSLLGNISNTFHIMDNARSHISKYTSNRFI